MASGDAHRYKNRRTIERSRARRRGATFITWLELRMATASADLSAVLDRIDADLDESLQRLFAFMRIASISTDPAYADSCRTAAAHIAEDLASIGFAPDVRQTAGHPVVTGKTTEGSGPNVLFYGHYDVQPVDPLDLWDTPPFEPRIST